jgi:N-acetylglucosamine kinase-like BadF-type ATPase
VVGAARRDVDLVFDLVAALSTGRTDRGAVVSLLGTGSVLNPS